MREDIGMEDTQEKWVEELQKQFEKATISDETGGFYIFPYIVDFIRKTREEAKREVIQELKKDASDHLESSENEEISNFWIDVYAWLKIKHLDSLTSKEGEEGKE